MKAALLIVDVQQALCTGDYAAFDAEGLIARINRVGRRARATGTPVVVIQHEEADGPLSHGSPGWQLAAGLEVEPPDLRIRKTACDSFHQTPLHSSLQALGVGRLVICGLQTEYCIDTTVRRALALGYAVDLVSDAHSTMDNDVLTAPQIIAHHNATLGHLTNFGPAIQTVAASDVRLDA